MQQSKGRVSNILAEFKKQESSQIISTIPLLIGRTNGTATICV